MKEVNLERMNKRKKEKKTNENDSIKIHTYNQLFIYIYDNVCLFMKREI